MALTKVSGSVLKDPLSLGGEVSIGGTLTYQDVTNVDAIGIITARAGVNVSAGQLDVGSNIKIGNAGIITASGLDISGDIDVDGHTNLDNVSIAGVTTFTGAIDANGDLDVDGHTNLDNVSIAGVSTFASNLIVNGGISADTTLYVGGNLTITDKILHDGDTNTAIRFPANDTISFETSGSEKLRVDSNGRLLVGATSTSAAVRAVFQGYHGGGDDYQARVQFQTNQATNLALNQHLANLLFTNSSGSVGAEIRAIADAAWGTNDYPGRLEFYTTPDGSNTSTERLRITSAGSVGINETSPDTKLHVRNGVLKIETDTNFYSGSGENGENYASIFLNSNHSSGNNPAHGKITVRHSNQNTYSGDLVLMPQGYYSGSYGYQEVLRVSAYKRVGINEPSPSAELDVQGDGAPVNINSSNSNTFKIKFEDNGTVRGYLGCDNTNLLNVGNSSGTSKFTVNTAGIAHNVDTTTHGSGVFMCEVHTDLLALLKSSQNHSNNVGMYYSWPDGGGASWTWDNGVLRMDSNIGSHTWQCGSVYLTPGYYTLMQCWRASPDAHGWSNFGSNSNGNGYYLTDDQAYGSYNTLLTSYAGQSPRNNGRTFWYGTTSGNFWHNVTSAGTYRIQQMGQPYGSGGYKYYILAAYLLKLK